MMPRPSCVSIATHDTPDTWPVFGGVGDDHPCPAAFVQANLSQGPPQALVAIDSLAHLLVDAGMEDVVSLDMTAVAVQRDFDALLLATGRSPQHALAGVHPCLTATQTIRSAPGIWRSRALHMGCKASGLCGQSCRGKVQRASTTPVVRQKHQWASGLLKTHVRFGVGVGGRDARDVWPGTHPRCSCCS